MKRDGDDEAIYDEEETPGYKAIRASPCVSIMARVSTFFSKKKFMSPDWSKRFTEIKQAPGSIDLYHAGRVQHPRIFPKVGQLFKEFRKTIGNEVQV